MSSKFVVKGYKIGSKIDHMGFRTIYHAFHVKTGQDVFLTAIQVRAGRSLENLKKRAEQSKKCSFPYLVSALDYGTLPNDYFYYTHRCIKSLPITRILDEISGDDKRFFMITRYFIQVLEAVEYLHFAQVTHRDLNTNQLRVDEQDNILLEGFVNAHPKVEPRAITNMVDLPYLSPEQISGAPADKKTDIYSLGVIFFEILANTLPYSSNYMKVDENKKGVVPTLTTHCLDIPSELDAMAMKALANRNARYRDVREWINDLEAFYSKRPISLKVKDFSNSLRSLFKVKV